jgi:Crinkler effector protein N-terminal domain
MGDDNRVLICLVRGESEVFEVEVPVGSSVLGLKNLVLKNGIKVSEDILANQLVLWKVGAFQWLARKLHLRPDRQLNEPVRVKPIKTLVARIKSLGDELSQFAVEIEEPTDKIADFFPQHPPEGHLHIIVQKPAGE